MRIEKLQFNQNITETKGISPINLERMGSIVALIGRNGSGKTRILDLLYENYANKISPRMLIDGSINIAVEEIPFFKNISTQYKEIVYSYYKVNELILELKTNPNDENLKNEYAFFHKKLNVVGTNPHLAGLHQNFLTNRAQIEGTLISKTRRHIQKINNIELKQLQEKIATTVAAQPNAAITFESLLEKIGEQDDYNEFTTIHTTALSYLSKLPHQLVHAYSESKEDETKNFHESVSYKRFESLKRFIKSFLNKDLEWSKEQVRHSIDPNGVTTTRRGVWKLNNRPFIYNQLSEGERSLFTYSLLFFLLDQNPRIKISESIIIIDEPELNLHPKSQIELIRGIRNIIKDNGQLWIATHSINILSDLTPDEIFMVKDNSIIPPSRATPIKAFNELMGLDDHIERLNHFISDISTWSYVNFMTECFNDPDTISSSKSDDPEIDALKKSIKEKPNGSILLDFGAGLGRVYKGIIADKLLGEKIQYHALEPEPSKIEELKKLNVKNLYPTYKSLPDNTFDYIVLCGVLHEISINEWVETLGRIKASLKESGYLIIIEDMKLPKGEKIQPSGFMILDIESTQELFAMASKPAQIFTDKESHKDRILCMSINKKDMGNVTYHTLKKSLAIRRNNALESIRKSRKAIANQENKLALGRESAFNSQLYINTILAEEVVNDIINHPSVLN
ncbi:MAG TPA: AAA family ATPase [Bacteroidia bacterium]|nr:AAA family ATPase [Bacteroidia bacterium]